jgi:hypothetical protein
MNTRGLPYMTLCFLSVVCRYDCAVFGADAVAVFKHLLSSGALTFSATTGPTALAAYEHPIYLDKRKLSFNMALSANISFTRNFLFLSLNAGYYHSTKVATLRTLKQIQGCFDAYKGIMKDPATLPAHLKALFDATSASEVGCRTHLTLKTSSSSSSRSSSEGIRGAVHSGQESSINVKDFQDLTVDDIIAFKDHKLAQLQSIAESSKRQEEKRHTKSMAKFYTVKQPRGTSASGRRSSRRLAKVSLVSHESLNRSEKAARSTSHVNDVSVRGNDNEALYISAITDVYLYVSIY